ncbi:hypothetical protein V6N12_039929 [Hibiscus sabdariffa]|uniref:Uncharacterized protein n=1 Tax=Hibiscus sabdariffa TaxID=183260 RepID=A0ABR2E274_9ROSI
MGERDGVLETLLFCAWKRTDRRGYFKVDWHTLNLETREISETLITMPPEVGDGFSAVSCRNHVFVLGGACPMDPSCPDGKTRKIHSHDHVFCFDSDHPDHGWKKAPPMSVPRWRPTAVAAEGKIYAFMGYDLAHFADIFDVSGSGWKLLTPPSDVDMGPLRLSYPVLFDSPRSRILVHFGTHDFNGKYPLYAYYIDDESWQCLNEDFGPWPHGVALVDGLFYCLLYPDVDRDLYCFSNQSCPLEPQHFYGKGEALATAFLWQRRDYLKDFARLVETFVNKPYFRFKVI